MAMLNNQRVSCAVPQLGSDQHPPRATLSWPWPPRWWDCRRKDAVRCAAHILRPCDGKKGWVENYGKLECLDHALGLCRAMFFWRVSTRTVQTGGIEEKWSWNNSSEQIKQGGENNISKLLLAAIQKKLFISSFLISLRSSSRAMENGNVYTMFKSWLNHLSLKSYTNGSFSMAMLNNQGYQGYTVTCCACSSQRRCTASSWQRQLLSPSTCRWVWGSQHDFSADSPPPEIFAARPGLWQVVSTTQHTHTVRI